MAACRMAGKEGARADPASIVEADIVAIVVATEGGAEGADAHPFPFFGIAPGLFYLADDA